MVNTKSSMSARNVDGISYEDRMNAPSDDAAFDADADYESAQPFGARGAANQPTNRDFASEDRDTEQSEISGRIPKGEVDDLLNSASDVQDVQGRTRGAKVDAWKQEKELDQALEDSGVADAEQDITIGKASG